MTWLHRYIGRIQRSPARWPVVAICSLGIMELTYRYLRHGSIDWMGWTLATMLLGNIVIRVWPLPQACACGKPMQDGVCSDADCGFNVRK